MAVYFRHGSNGAYKSAYAVWFEILPALRNGRLVVTNIEGLKPMETIEKLLGEKFPPGAQLIRIFSRSDNGVYLWQNWFSWMPSGALIVIDECQDLYTADVGFKREKAQRKPFEEFVDLLPPEFSELYYSRWTKVDPSTLDEGDTDDTGGTQVDEQGRLLYPNNFYGAFMRHRKYQWDIIMLTPDWTAIPTWLRGCAQEAYSHRSTDTFFRKRKPRIFNHRPNSTKTAPSTKADFASCTSKKIPVDVFALYKSTGTGGFNESKADITILKSPKFLLAILIGVAAIGKFVWDLNHVLSDSDESAPSEIASAPEADSFNDSGHVQNTMGTNKATASGGSGVVRSNDTTQASSEIVFDAVNPFFEHFGVFNGAEAVYLSSVQRRVFKSHAEIEYLFRVDKPQGAFYVRSQVLSDYGYRFLLLDDCTVVVNSDLVERMITCAPYDSQAIVKNEVQDKAQQLESVDIFNLNKSKDI